MQVKSAVVRSVGAPFTFEDLELDELRADEVLVQVRAVGVCHTDDAVRNQAIPAPLPAVLGHEGAGVVEAVGPLVTTLVPGDHVVLTFDSCGKCRACVSARPAHCENAMGLWFGGVRSDGSATLYETGEDRAVVHGHFFGQSSFATHALATERNAVKVPDDIDLGLLAGLGCGFQTGAGAVLNTLKLERGRSIAVLGSGSVGLAAIMAARVAGAATLIAVDILDERLALAKELGATHTINAAQENVAERIRELTDGRGVDAVLEVTGRTELVEMTLQVLAPGGKVGLIGSPKFDAVAQIPIIVLSGGASIQGIIEGDSLPQTFIPELIALYRSGDFPLEKLVTFYEFDQINEAFEDTHAGKAVKPVLRLP